MQCYMNHMGKDILMGEHDFLYFATFNQYYEAWKSNQLSRGSTGFSPERFIYSGGLVHFRFPFPDEAHTNLGGYQNTDPNRTLVLTMERGNMWPEECFTDSDYRTVEETQRNPNPNAKGDTVTVEIINMCLWRDSARKPYLTPTFRCFFSGEVYDPSLEQESFEFLLEQITKHYVFGKTVETAAFWKQVINILTEGYELELALDPMH